jgi:predicted RNase H-like HicB family nuclease
MKYPIVLHTDNGQDFGVTVPDLPGCFSAGSSVEEAIENANEAILCHAEGMIIDNETVPLPSEIVDLTNFNPDVGTALIAYVDVDIEAIKGPAKRINITVRRANLEVIDIRAKARGMNRSEYLAYAGTHFEETQKENRG